MSDRFYHYKIKTNSSSQGEELVEDLLDTLVRWGFVRATTVMDAVIDLDKQRKVSGVTVKLRGDYKWSYTFGNPEPEEEEEPDTQEYCACGNPVVLYGKTCGHCGL